MADAVSSKAAAPMGTKVVAVTTLTSLDGNDLRTIGVDRAPHDQVLHLTELAMTAGVDGIVCSGAEVKAAHALWPKGFFVVPGVRPANGAIGDQKRVVTPREATSRASCPFSDTPIPASFIQTHPGRLARRLSYARTDSRMAGSAPPDRNSIQHPSERKS